MLTKISSSFEYLLVIFIFTSRFAFRLQIDTNEEAAESTKLNVDNAAAAAVPIADQVLIYGNFKLKGSLLPTLPQSRPADPLLLINFDSYQ
uniref:Uncharacterized protein n=1 Tax=Romanomermis culicivorax TaxID=13658 RepID=A0A915J6A7_ROMCU